MTDITLYSDVTIDSDLTIPEGVTVRSDRYSVTVDAAKDAVTLTVDGGLELTGRNSALVLTDGEDDDGSVLEAVLVANGHVAYTYTGDEDMNLDVAGAHYQAEVSRQTVWMISNVTYASENCDNGTIYITGNVSAGDIAFNAAEDETITIYVLDIMENGDVAENSALTVSSMDLGVEVALNMTGTTINAEEYEGGTITGAVKAAYGDGTSDAQIDMIRASGMIVSAEAEENSDGVLEYDMVLGASPVGAVTVSAGTVTADNNLSVARNNTNNTVLTVASGATLLVPRNVGMSVSVSSDVDGYAFVVDGTMSVVGGTATLGGTIVNGTLDITNDEGISASVNASGLTVTGTVNVVDVANRNNVLTVTGVLTVGVKPVDLGTVAGAGKVIGSIQFGNQVGTKYIKAYPGSDLSQAQIEWDSVNAESQANSTEYYINDTLYMTIYVSSGDSSTTVYSVIDAEEFVLNGLNNGLNYEDGTGTDSGLYAVESWFTSPTMELNTVISKDNTKISQTEAVYAQAQPAEMTGVVSVGTGITLYIDGVPVDRSSATYDLAVGTHTVSIDIQAGYDGTNAAITFNGTTVTSGQITITENGFNLTASGAVPASDSVVIDNSGSSDLGLTDYLLIILVILIVIMAIIVALRLMRS